MQEFCLVIQVARVCTQFVEYHQSKKGTVNAYRPLANLETKVSQRYDLGSHHFIGLDLTLGTSQTSQIGLLKSSLWLQKDVNMLNKVRVIRPAPMLCHRKMHCTNYENSSSGVPVPILLGCFP